MQIENLIFFKYKQTTKLHFMGVVMISKEFLLQSGEISSKIFLVYFGILVQKHCCYTSCQPKFPRTPAGPQLPFCFIGYLLLHVFLTYFLMLKKIWILKNTLSNIIFFKYSDFYMMFELKVSQQYTTFDF